MQQIIAVWTGLDLRKRVIVIGATMAMFAAVLAVANLASRPTMALLYASLEPGPAGEIVAALEARGETVDVRGGSIYVEANRRDELRMTLAADGLPANSAKGYELLDNISGFGTTSQMFDAAYWRAKEGELARTIVASPLISSARVHIAVPEAQTFRSRGKPSGSVTVTPAGDSLSGAQAKALRYLVASAVPGLEPQDVSVIDARGGRIVSGDDSNASPDAQNRAERLKRNVERLLEARVGYGNAIVELSVDTVTQSETITERKFDPQGRVAIATDTAETSAAASDAGNNGVTVASNLPSGNGSGAGGKSSSNNTETRERINYEVSETKREVNRAPGAISRISAAVLVDGIRSTNDAGEPVWQPRSKEELAALRELVASAIGFNEARGDTITIKSLEFKPLSVQGATPPTGFLSSLQLDMGAIVRAAILAVTALVLGFFVLRPILTANPAVQETNGRTDPASALDTSQSREILPAISGEIEDGTELGDTAVAVLTPRATGRDSDPELPALAAGVDPVARLRSLIEERQDETVEILRGWMQDDSEEPA